MIALALTPLIACPMLFISLRRLITFELRKTLHYLSVVWGLAICFHAPTQYVGIIMGLAVGVYVTDYLYGIFFKISYHPTLKLRRLTSAVEVTFETPKDFQNGGYIYICLPWISRTQWHPFSLFEKLSLPGHSSVCMAAVGDWTKAVHANLERPSSRPAWIYGPFPSPFTAAVNFDNLIAIASGIGITPTLGLIVPLGKTRRINLIWMCRDADLIEFYLDNLRFNRDDDAWTFVFYTGKRDLLLSGKKGN